MSATAIKVLTGSKSIAPDFYPYTIENSARFNNLDNAHLAKTFLTTPTSRTTCTDSVWVKLTGKRNGSNINILLGTGNNWEALSFVEPANINGWRADQIRSTGMTSPQTTLRTASVYRDYGGWFHVMRVWDSTNATAADRHRLYINGVRLTDFDEQVNASLNQQLVDWLSTSAATYISSPSATQSFDGYMAEVVVLDGTAASPTDLGELKNGVWIPKDPSGLTFGTNGFHLDFADSSNLGNDVSGNNNDFTSGGLTSSDQMIDTPTNNFATLAIGSAHIGYVPTVSEGNLKYATQNSTGTLSSTGLPRSGVWYVEWQSPNCYPGGGYRGYFGLTSATNGNLLSSSTTYWLVQGAGGAYVGGDYFNYGTVVGTGTNSLGPGDIGSLTIDMDNLQITFRLNNSVVASGVAILDAPQSFCLLGDGTPSLAQNTIFNINFGQNGDFNGYETAQGNTDENGIGDFYYTPPSGALALCTANLPEPTIGPNSATITSEVFEPILYTGNGTSQSISTLDFQPDFTWIKNRDATDNHMLFDAVRGATKYLSSNTTNVEATDAQSLSSFNSNGFSVGNNVAVNTNAEDYVAWNWKGNGAGVTNTDGSVTSTVSANQNAGISIVTYTGSSSGISVGHGLSSAPEMIIWKARATPNTSARSWIVWTKDLTSTDYIMYLNLPNAQTAVTAGSVLASSPTATTFSLGTEPSVNWNAENYVSYCFHSVEGFSSFGKYTGNGSTDGSFIYTGFRPAFVIIKRIDAANDWYMYDTARDTYNAVDHTLYANFSNAESAATEILDVLSNGFKIRLTAVAFNASAGTYIYMAFAENPFKYANAR